MGKAGIILTDTNVVVRVLLKDYNHPQYDDCSNMLKQGCVISNYVIPEIFYIYTKYIKQVLVRDYAEDRGELQSFTSNPVAYIAKFIPPSGWKKQAYVDFYAALQNLESSFPELKFTSRDLVYTAIKVGRDTGLDWVDCMLIAESILHNAKISSIDTPLLKALAVYHSEGTDCKKSPPPSKMSLEG